MQEYTTDTQALYLKKVENFLERECSLRIAQSTIAISDIAAFVTMEDVMPKKDRGNQADGVLDADIEVEGYFPKKG